MRRQWKAAGGSGIIFNTTAPLGVRFYSSKSIEEKLNPYFVTGFTDGEGCFHISIIKNKKLKLGWQVRLSFEINLNEKDIAILVQIKIFFRVGSIDYNKKTKSFLFRVNSQKDLIIIIDHFEKYPLITQKQTDFKLFQQVYYLMLRGEHLTQAGLQEIIAFRASVNRGLSQKLLSVFPDIVPVLKPLAVVKNQNIIRSNPNWISGFTSAEGCFFIDIYKSKTKLGEAVKLEFQLTQHSKDKQLLINFINFLECGEVYEERKTVKTKTFTWFKFKVTKFQDIANKIIPLFKKYPIIGVKALDFAAWCQVASMMKEKKHLTVEGLEQIKKIKAGMNTGRKFD